MNELPPRPAEGTAAGLTGPVAEPVRVGPAHEGLAVGFVPGVMPSKWFRRWDQRMEAASARRPGAAPARSRPAVALERVPLPEGGGLEALAQETAHMVLLRPEAEPEALNPARFHAVHLYEEQPVVVLPVEHLLTVLEEVPVEELGEELLLQDPAEVPQWQEARARYAAAHPELELPTRLPSMRDRADAVELVAAGLGLLVLPLSLARFHHRKDLTYRPVTGMPSSSVHLVWPRLLPGYRPEEDEAVLQEFVGITRGRRAESSRGELLEHGGREPGATASQKAVPKKPGSRGARTSGPSGARGGRARPGSGKSSARRPAGRKSSSPRGRR